MITFFSSNLFPVMVYLFAYLIPNKKWFILYVLFILAIYVSAFTHESCMGNLILGISNILDKTRTIALSLFLYSFGTSILGILGKAFIFYQEDKGHKINPIIIQMIGLIIIMIFKPFLDLVQLYLFNYIENNFCSI